MARKRAGLEWTGRGSQSHGAALSPWRPRPALTGPRPRAVAGVEGPRFPKEGTREVGQREETGLEMGQCLYVTPYVLHFELQGRHSHCHFTITIGRAGPKRVRGKGLAPARRWSSPGSRSSQFG